jgi:hypothetical protein
MEPLRESTSVATVPGGCNAWSTHESAHAGSVRDPRAHVRAQSNGVSPESIAAALGKFLARIAVWNSPCETLASRVYRLLSIVAREEKRATAAQTIVDKQVASGYFCRAPTSPKLSTYFIDSFTFRTP